MSEIYNKDWNLEEYIKSLSGYKNIQAVPGLMIRAFLEFAYDRNISTLELALDLSEKIPTLGTCIEIKVRFDEYLRAWKIKWSRSLLKEVFATSIAGSQEEEAANNQNDKRPSNNDQSV